jgi:ribosomal protein L7Ae-like RNA K-turn-binding protein
VVVVAEPAEREVVALVAPAAERRAVPVALAEQQAQLAARVLLAARRPAARPIQVRQAVA